MAWQLYLRGTTTAPGTQVFTSTAGTPTSAILLDLWWDYGSPGSAAYGARLVPRVLSGATWLTSGSEPLDKACFQYRIVGSVNASSDPLFAPVLRDWTPMGTDLPAELGDFRGDCALQVDVRLSEPIDGGTLASFSWDLLPGWNTNVDACPVGVSEVGGVGILTGLGDDRITEWVTASLLTESGGGADDHVHFSGGSLIVAGAAVTVTAGTATLNQNDSAPSALTAGQAYIAMLSVGSAGTVTVTKGVRAALASVVAPNIPAGEAPLGRVIVNYQAGASVIATADITQYADDGQGLVTDTTGLIVNVARLRAIVDRGLISRSVPELVTVTDDATTTIWLTNLGEVSIVSGCFPLATVTAAAGDITGVTDARVWVPMGQTTLAGHRIVDGVQLQAATPGSAQTGHLNISGTAKATTFSGALSGNATTASDGLSSATGTAPLTLNLAAKALTGSVAITPTNDGGAVALQGTTPGTAQSGNVNLTGTHVLTGSLVHVGDVLSSRSKALADATPTDFATFTIADGAMHSGRILYEVRSVKGTALQVLIGEVYFAASREGSTYTTVVGTTAETASQVLAAAAGSLTGGVTIAGTGGVVTLTATFDTSQSTPDSMTLRYRIESPDATLAITGL